MPDSHIDQIRKLEERFSRFRIMSSADMTIEGSLRHGYAVNCPICEENDPNQCGGGIAPTVGACCLPDGTCEEVTPGQCLLDGGTFIGGLCADADCQPTGACCVGEDCSITTEDDCTGMGGTYQGDGSTCDPNPCFICDGPCGFFNPDDGMYYLTKVYNNVVDNSGCHNNGECVALPPPSSVHLKYYEKSGPPVSLVASQSFHFEGTECIEGDPVFENVAVRYNCFCDCLSDFGCDTFECNAGCTGCINNEPPDVHWPVCSIINTNITYEDLSPCQ